MNKILLEKQPFGNFGEEMTLSLRSLEEIRKGGSIPLITLKNPGAIDDVIGACLRSDGNSPEWRFRKLIATRMSELRKQGEEFSQFFFLKAVLQVLASLDHSEFRLYGEIGGSLAKYFLRKRIMELVPPDEDNRERGTGSMRVLIASSYKGEPKFVELKRLKCLESKKDPDIDQTSIKRLFEYDLATLIREVFPFEERSYLPLCVKWITTRRSSTLCHDCGGVD
ncbi:MAG: hypothetical protein HGA67_00760 [Candidatus Yonathbacteria bacterium]|nr:hypothetical protein [Candidatus Yonathbacteria bacterium]